MPQGGTAIGRLPKGFTVYKRTPTFDRDSLPEGLRRQHALKEGVWGVITIERGRVHYTIDGDPDQVFELDPQTPGLVAPEEAHHVQIMDGDTRFHVSFYRAE